jgi:hypothetical protein
MPNQSYASKWDAKFCQLTLLVPVPHVDLETELLANAKITIIRGSARKEYILANGDVVKLTGAGLVFGNDFLSDIFLQDNSVGSDKFFDIKDFGNFTFARDALSTPVLSFLNIVSVKYDCSETNSSNVIVEVIGSPFTSTSDEKEVTIICGTNPFPKRLTDADEVLFNQLKQGKSFPVSINVPSAPGKVVSADFKSGIMNTSTINPIKLLSIPELPPIPTSDIRYVLNASEKYSARVKLPTITTKTASTGFDLIENILIDYKLLDSECNLKEEKKDMLFDSLNPNFIMINDLLVANTNSTLQIFIKNSVGRSDPLILPLNPIVYELPKDIDSTAVKILVNDSPILSNEMKYTVYGTSLTVSGWKSEDIDQKNYSVDAWLEVISDVSNTKYKPAPVIVKPSRNISGNMVYSLSDLTFINLSPGSYDLHIQAISVAGKGKDVVYSKTNSATTIPYTIVVKSIPNDISNDIGINIDYNPTTGFADGVLFNLQSFPAIIYDAEDVVPGSINVLIGSDSTFSDITMYDSYSWDISQRDTKSKHFILSVNDGQIAENVSDNYSLTKINPFTTQNTKDKKIYFKFVVQDLNDPNNLSVGLIKGDLTNYQTRLPKPVMTSNFPVQLFDKNGDDTYNMLFDWVSIPNKIMDAAGTIADSVQYVILDKIEPDGEEDPLYADKEDTAKIALSPGSYTLYLYASYKNSQGLCLSQPLPITFTVLDINQLTQPQVQSKPILEIDNKTVPSNPKLSAYVVLSNFIETVESVILELTETFSGVVEVFPVNNPQADGIKPTVFNLSNITANTKPGKYEAKVIVQLKNISGSKFSVESSVSDEVRLVPVLAFSGVKLSLDKKSIDFKINRIQTDAGKVEAFMILENGSLEQDDSIEFIADSGLSVNKTITTSAADKITSFILIASAGTQQALVYFDGSNSTYLPQQVVG